MQQLNAELFIKLPPDILNYILELCGFHKLRNGKYCVLLDRRKDIFNLLLNITFNLNGWISLPIKTQRFRNSF